MCCAPYFVNLNNNTFQLKCYYSLFIYFHCKREQEKSSRLSNLQCCHFHIIILRVAIISNVQNVRIQRWHRPTDDASTCWWRGSQQIGPVCTTQRSTLAQLVDVLDSAVVYVQPACPVLYIFFPVLAVQKLLKSAKIWQSCSQMHTAMFYEPRQKCRF